MAVVKMPQPSALGIKVQTGISAGGNPMYKIIRFNGVKAAATDDDVHAVGLALAGLQKHQLSSIVRFDSANLVNQ